MTTFIQDNIATILLNEEVTMENSKEIVDFIYGSSFLNEVDTIKVSINSPGGSVMGGLSIFSALVSSDKKVITHIDGIAASIAAVIFMAGQERTMMEYGLFMIHNPFGGDDKVLNKIKNSLMLILGEDNFKNLSTMMDEETWLDSTEMKDLINGVIKIENGEMKDVTNKALELFEIVNQIKKEEMENLENQEASIENETLESSLEDRVENLDEALEPTLEVDENTSEFVDGETEEKVSEEIVAEEVEIENVEADVEVEDVNPEIEAELEEEVEIEAELEVSEEVEAEVEELELVENKIEEVSNVLELTNKLKEQEETILDLTNKLSIYEKEADNKAKLSLLENSSINKDDYSNWLELDIEIIEKLAGTVNKVSPKIEISKDGLKFSELSNEMKEDLKENDYETYSKLFFENK
jgi:ATP-dependent protease ClpP protease subunit